MERESDKILYTTLSYDRFDRSLYDLSHQATIGIQVDN